jgi:glutamyl-tRNA synthetase
LVKIADSLSTTSSFPDLVAALDALDDQLTLRTFLVGRSLSEADFAIWGVIKASPKIAGVFKGGRQPHLSRWYTYIEGLPTTEAAIANLIEARATKVPLTKTLFTTIMLIRL